MRIHLWLAAIMAIAAVGLLSSADSAAGYGGLEKYGTDSFDSVAVVDLEVDTTGDGVLDTAIPGVTLSGPVLIERRTPAGDDGNDNDPYTPKEPPHRDSGVEPDGLADIATEIVQMELTGTVSGIGTITIRAGSDFGLPATTGAIEEQAAGTDFPADSFFDVFFELLGTPYGPLTNFLPNSPDAPVHMECVITGIPPIGCDYTNPYTNELKDGFGVTRVSVTNEVHTPLAGIGGTTELLVGGSDALSAAEGSGSSAPLYAAIAGVAAAVVALAASSWYVRRRWLG